MDAGDWISLLTCAGALGGFAFFIRLALGSGNEEQPFRPVWLVLLAGGTARPDRPDNFDGGGGVHRPPRVPPRDHTSGSPESELPRAAALQEISAVDPDLIFGETPGADGPPGPLQQAVELYSEEREKEKSRG